MKIFMMTANPVMSSAETQTIVPAVFTTKEKMVEYEKNSRLQKREEIDGCWFTYKVGSVLRSFNGSSVGDYHRPESQFGEWCVNPCIFDVQFRELETKEGWDETLAKSGWPVDPMI